MFAANFFSTYTSMMLMCTVQGWILLTEFMGSFWFCLHSLPEIVSENSVHYALQHEHEHHARVSCERFSSHVVVIKLLYGGWFQSCSMQHQQPHRHKYIPYREKTFVNFKVLWLFSFLHENLIFHQFTKVFYWKRFPLYDSPIPVKHAIPIS